MLNILFMNKNEALKSERGYKKIRELRRITGNK